MQQGVRKLNGRGALVRDVIVILFGLGIGMFFCARGWGAVVLLMLSGMALVLLGVVSTVVFGGDVHAAIRLEGVLGPGKMVAVGYSLLLASFVVAVCGAVLRIFNSSPPAE